MILIDHDRTIETIREVGASLIIPGWRNLDRSRDVMMKAANDPVTVVDQAAEKALKEKLLKIYPDATTVGEEEYAANASILSRLKGDAPVLVIDPIDGTKNFIDGIPEFGAMVALVHKGEALAAWIHDPVSGDTVSAEKGGGVWLRGHRMRLAAQDLTKPLGLIGGRLKKFLPATTERQGWPDFTLGSSASFDYPRLFSGAVTFANAQTPRASFSVYHQTNPWDHVPGNLLFREAGGFSADWKGNPYDMTNLTGGLINAPSEDEWQRLHGLLSGVIQRIRGPQPA